MKRDFETIKTALEKIKALDFLWDKENKKEIEAYRAPTLIQPREGTAVLILSAEDGGFFADYYGEYRGGDPWIDPRLENWAKDNDFEWQWRDPGTVELFDTNPAPEPETIVIFRTFKGGGDVIALFPYEPATRDGRLCQSYQHLGQHSSANYSGVISMTDPATEEEYAPLKRELEGKPFKYNLRVLKRRGNRKV